MKNNRLCCVIGYVLAIGAVVRAVPAAGEISIRHELPNGMRIDLYEPDAILEQMTERDDEGRLIMRLEDGTGYLLIDDISDPVITNSGDGSFHPMKTELVLGALGDVCLGSTEMDIEIEVYILPYPRSGLLASSNRGNRIFLSPGVYEIGFYTGYCIITHEFGHAFQNRYAPDEEGENWIRYLNLRGIYGDPRFMNYTCHMDNPREVFAEDFRFLFGGEPARYSGTIENRSLTLPDQVSGLEEFFIALSAGEAQVLADGAHPAAGRLISSTVYPNPFNPSTTIRVELDGGAAGAAGDVGIGVYRADGALVKQLRSGPAVEGIVTALWDGRDRNGRDVASGVYFYRVRCGRELSVGKMLIIR